MFYIIQFIYLYSFISVAGLVKDIFFQEVNNIKAESLQNVVNDYTTICYRNVENIRGVIPFFVILEIMYYFSNEYSIFSALFQVPIYFYLGYIIHSCVRINLSNDNFPYKLDRHNKHIKNRYVFMALNRDIKELYLVYLLPIVIMPFIFGSNKLTYDILFGLSLIYTWAYYMNNLLVDIWLLNFYEILKLQEVDDFVRLVITKFTNLSNNIKKKYLNKSNVTLTENISENYDDMSDSLDNKNGDSDLLQNKLNNEVFNTLEDDKDDNTLEDDKDDNTLEDDQLDNRLEKIYNIKVLSRATVSDL